MECFEKRVYIEKVSSYAKIDKILHELMRMSTIFLEVLQLDK